MAHDHKVSADHIIDRVNDCVGELDDLTAPLDALHQTVRSAIWQEDKK